MKNKTVILVVFFSISISILHAQDAKQNYLKAQEFYAAGQYLEAERKLNEVENQLGEPKVATTALIILCQYKSNNFNSYDLLERVKMFKAMNPENTDVYKEIIQIESTVISWRKDLDARIAAIVASKELSAAKKEADTNFKIKDYNVIFDKLFDEIQYLNMNPGITSPYKDWYGAFVGLRKIEAVSSFGFQAAATERIVLLEKNLIKKIVFDKYPDEAERLYIDLLRTGYYYDEVIKNTQERRVNEARLAEERRVADLKRRETEARIAEEKRLAEIKKREERMKELLQEAERLDQNASGHRVLGGVMFAGGVAGVGLAVFSIMDLLNREDSSESSTLHMLGGSFGFGIGYFLLSTQGEQFQRARYYDEQADEKRREAQRYSASVYPLLGVDKYGFLAAGFTIRLEL